jgi:hypothetical protein
VAYCGCEGGNELDEQFHAFVVDETDDPARVFVAMVLRCNEHIDRQLEIIESTPGLSDTTDYTSIVAWLRIPGDLLVLRNESLPTHPLLITTIDWDEDRLALLVHDCQSNLPDSLGAGARAFDMVLETVVDTLAQTTDARVDQETDATCALPMDMQRVSAEEIRRWLALHDGQFPALGLEYLVSHGGLVDVAAAIELLLSWGVTGTKLPGIGGQPGDYSLMRWLIAAHPSAVARLQTYSTDPRTAATKRKIQEYSNAATRVLAHPPVGLGMFAQVAVRMAEFWTALANATRQQ